MPFLDYYKLILDRVRFYPELFEKEYKKAERHLPDADIGDLNQWINERGFQSLLNQRDVQKVKNYSKMYDHL